MNFIIEQVAGLRLRIQYNVGMTDDAILALQATELAYLRDAYLQNFTSTVTAVDGARVAFSKTLFYPTGGGQPHDIGTLGWNGHCVDVTEVTKSGTTVWHTLGSADSVPAVGDDVTGTLNWERRHQLMRTHTARQVLCGVIWQKWGAPVTGGNMEPLRARMDFEFDPLPDGFAATVEELVNAELAADRLIEVSFLPHAAAQTDPDLIRTKVNMIPSSVTEIRIVDIVGLDKQADGGTHVRTTSEVGRIRVEKTESKGKGNKRMRIEILD
jgi:misacylated tRNA(Ala) deacylase